MAKVNMRTLREAGLKEKKKHLMECYSTKIQDLKSKTGKIRNRKSETNYSLICFAGAIAQTGMLH